MIVPEKRDLNAGVMKIAFFALSCRSFQELHNGMLGAVIAASVAKLWPVFGRKYRKGKSRNQCSKKSNV